MKTLTDSEGNQYELILMGQAPIDKTFVIRPIAPIEADTNNKWQKRVIPIPPGASSTAFGMSIHNPNKTMRYVTNYNPDPIEAEQKKDLWWHIGTLQDFTKKHSQGLKFEVELGNYSEPQAEAVAEAIKALLAYLHDPKDRQDYDGKTPIPANLYMIKAAEARQLIQGAQDE